MWIVALIIAVFWLAYSNGANDNFKGVATLYGSATTGYRRALSLATLSTLGGSLLSMLLASSLAKSFSGNGIVRAELAGTDALLVSVGGAAAATILLATLLGMPTSTTHALTGALAGIAMISGTGALPAVKLWNSFFLPLLASPLLAISAACIVYPLFHQARRRLGVTRDTCICVGSEPVPEFTGAVVAEAHARAAGDLRVAIGSADECAHRYAGHVIGLNAQSAVNGVHYVSAAAVCFARAINDTPKIAALLLAGGAAGGTAWKLGLVAAAMAAGGLLNSRRVAETISNRITELNPGQGLTGNLVTAALVLGASWLGLPVSTTHVSCGSLFGIGFITGQAHWRTVAQIMVTWVTTLPCGAALGAGLFWILVH